MNFDYIIIGGGSAGCVLANRFSENPANSVLLLEAGGQDKSFKIDIPLAYSQLYHSEYDWNLTPEPLSKANDQVIFYPRGKGVGGSSLINSMIYIRGNRKDYDEWSALGNKGWSYEDVLPYFKKSECHWKGESVFHGGNGLMGVTPAFERYSNPLWQALTNAGTDIGLKPNDDFNGSTQEGLGIFDMTIREGKRQSTASTFLKTARHRKNLFILTEAVTEKIDINNKIATGVTFIHRGQTKIAKANREVILSAGAIHSPQILMLSGIGNGHYLTRHGIKIKHDLAGVGQNLKDHYFFPISYEINKPISFNSQMRNFNLLKNVFQYILTKKGPMAIGAASAGGFVNLDSDRPDLQFHFAPTWGFRINSKIGDLPKTDGMTLLPTILQPKSTGYIGLKSSDVTDAPIIELNYFDNDYDKRFVVKAYRFAHQLLNSKSFEPYRTSILRPSRELESDDEILDWVLSNVDTCYHPVGTCKMGNDALAVVNDKLQVHGIEKLRVVDASVMPTIVSGNTNAPTIMIAEKGADLILKP